MDWYGRITEQFAKYPWFNQIFLSKCAVVILSLMLISMAADLTWRIIPQGNRIQPLNLIYTDKGGADASSSVDVTTIVSRHLFGKFEPKKVEVVEEIQPIANDVPETSLNVRLTGVVAIGEKATQGAAIIESMSKQATYVVNDTIAGTQAVLKKIFSDRVILQYRGRFETLMLDGIDYHEAKRNRQQQVKKTASKPKPKKKSGKAKVDKRHDKALIKELKAQREAFMKEPKKIFDYIRISPVRRDGSLAGYRLRPGKDPSLFKKTGLKSGDMAVEINGYDLKDMQQAMTVLRELRQMTEASIVVERGDQQVEVLFGLE